MATPDHVREPCPDRILDDLGGAFSMGAVGGSAYHFIVGSKNSPRGERIRGGFQAVTLNAPRVGGSFAVWGGLFSTFDCGMVYLRQKEDPWNSILAGAATGGFLQMRQGLPAATRSAIFGGVLLALIEGSGIMLNRMLASQPPPPPRIEESAGMPRHGAGIPVGARGGGSPQSHLPPGVPNFGGGELGNVGMSSSGQVAEEKGGFFSGLFGGKKKKEEGHGSGENLEIFVPGNSPPVPNFEIK